MTLSLVEHGSRTKKVKIVEEHAKNPEGKRQELMKKEEEKILKKLFSTAHAKRA